MKKPLAMILTIIGGILANAVICAAGVFAYPVHVVVYILAAAGLISVYSPVLMVAVKNTADKSGVSRKVLYICAQAPIFTAVLVNFIIQLVTYDPPSDNGIFGGWRYVNLGLSLGIALCMLVTSVLTTAFVFITAAVVKRKGLDL